MEAELFLSGIPSASDVRIENYNDTFTIYDGGIDGTGGHPSDNNWHVAMFVFNGASSKYRVDGGSDTVFGSNPGNNPINSIKLGNYQGNSSVQPATYNLGEFACYSGDQSTNESAIFGYLTNRWAINSGSSSSTASSSITATSTSTNSINIMWNSVSNAVGYTLYWGTSSGNYNQMISGPSSQTNLVANGLAPNTVYYLAATATASDGTESAYSAEVVYEPLSAPIAPTGLHVVLNP